jgi:hypothetical protein
MYSESIFKLNISSFSMAIEAKNLPKHNNQEAETGTVFCFLTVDGDCRIVVLATSNESTAFTKKRRV